MIRSFKVEDTREVSELINRAKSGYEIEEIKEIQINAIAFVVYEDQYIRGFAYSTINNNDANEKEAQIKLYVDSKSRRQGIGTSLYDHLLDIIKTFKPDILTSYIRVDIENPSSFCDRLGFHKWWGSPELYYNGTSFPEVELEFSKYEDRYFNQYVKMVQECFYEVHKENDIKPYLASEEIVRKYKLNNKDKVYLVLEEEKIMVSVTIGEGTIDNLMVSKAAQGKGYGKKALQFAMNKLLSQGYDEIRIC